MYVGYYVDPEDDPRDYSDWDEWDSYDWDFYEDDVEIPEEEWENYSF